MQLCKPAATMHSSIFQWYYCVHPHGSLHAASLALFLCSLPCIIVLTVVAAAAAPCGCALPAHALTAFSCGCVLPACITT